MSRFNTQIDDFDLSAELTAHFGVQSSNARSTFAVADFESSLPHSGSLPKTGSGRDRSRNSETSMSADRHIAGAAAAFGIAGLLP